MYPKTTSQAPKANAGLTTKRWPCRGDRLRPTYGIYAYTGREWDPETNLYYYRARYYDPKIGRFISEDTIGFAGGFNLYRYVKNRPTVLSDPLGLCSCDECPSGIWYGGGASGVAMTGTFFTGSAGAFRVTCAGKFTLSADIGFGCGGGLGVTKTGGRLLAASIDFVVCYARCKEDLKGVSFGFTVQGFTGLGLGATVTGGSDWGSTCFAIGPGLGAGLGLGSLGCAAGEL